MNRLARLLRRLGAAFLVRDDRTPAGHTLRSGASRHAKLSSLMLGTATLALALVAQAGSQAKLIDHERLLLGDLTRDVPEYLARFDLGEAPPPGGARTLLRVEVLRALREAGVEIDKLSLPGSMRVEGATRRWSREELIPWLTPVVTAALPEGVTLVDLSPFGALVTSPSATPAAVQLARLPKRAGRVSTTALVELRRDGRPLQRVSVSLVVDVSAQAARFAIERGATVDLTVDVGAAHVTARATALSNGDIGDRINVRVVQTRRVVDALVVSSSEVRLEGS